MDRYSHGSYSDISAIRSPSAVTNPVSLFRDFTFKLLSVVGAVSAADGTVAVAVPVAILPTTAAVVVANRVAKKGMSTTESFWPFVPAFCSIAASFALDFCRTSFARCKPWLICCSNSISILPVDEASLIIAVSLLSFLLLISVLLVITSPSNPLDCTTIAALLPLGIIRLREGVRYPFEKADVSNTRMGVNSANGNNSIDATTVLLLWPILLQRFNPCIRWFLYDWFRVSIILRNLNVLFIYSAVSPMYCGNYRNTCSGAVVVMMILVPLVDVFIWTWRDVCESCSGLFCLYTPKRWKYCWAWASDPEAIAKNGTYKIPYGG